MVCRIYVYAIYFNKDRKPKLLKDCFVEFSTRSAVHGHPLYVFIRDQYETDHAQSLTLWLWPLASRNNAAGKPTPLSSQFFPLHASEKIENLSHVHFEILHLLHISVR